MGFARIWLLRGLNPQRCWVATQGRVGFTSESQEMTLRVRVNSRSAAVAGPKCGEVWGCLQCREPGAFVSRCLVIRGGGGQLVWTQCAMGGRGWIESCATGPDQVNIGGAPRKAAGTAKGPLGGRETMDAEVALVRSLVLMLMLMLDSVLAEDAGVGDIYLQYGTYWKVSPAVTVVRQTTARMRSDLVSLGKRWAK